MRICTAGSLDKLGRPRIDVRMRSLDKHARQVPLTGPTVMAALGPLNCSGLASRGLRMSPVPSDALNSDGLVPWLPSSGSGALETVPLAR